MHYCNRNCRCSNDADFRPVCDNKGTHTFYSPCHAGCTFSEVRNGITTYSECSCVETVMGAGKTDAIDGPCTSNRCQFNWVAFEVSYSFPFSTILKNFHETIYLILFVNELSKLSKLYNIKITYVLNIVVLIISIINNKIFILNNLYILPYP